MLETVDATTVVFPSPGADPVVSVGGGAEGVAS